MWLHGELWVGEDSKAADTTRANLPKAHLADEQRRQCLRTALCQ